MYKSNSLSPMFALLFAVAVFSSAQAQDTAVAEKAVQPEEAQSDFASKEDGFKPMFTQDSFEGWVRLGGKAKYEIKDGVVTGTCVAGEPNSFMATGMDYTNFILELEFKVDPAMNSGVQIRSNCFANKTKFEMPDGKTKSIPAGRVHGYQVEIDPSDRRWSGGIYDEARRAWINDLSDKKPAREAFKPNSWNHYRIKCDGDHIQTWINGVAAADLKDSVTADGFIALQVHGAYRKTEMIGTTVQWRNIRIKLLD
jgi:hypothetical protein